MRLFVSGLILLAAGLPVLPASGEPAPALPPPAEGRQPLVSVLAGERAARIDALLTELSTADADHAPSLEARVRAMWRQSGSATADLFLGYAELAGKARQTALALDLLDQAVEHAPLSPEVYFRRAAVERAAGQLSPAVADIETALRLEPRYFPAMLAMADILGDLDDHGRALAMLRRAQLVAPHLAGLDDAIETIVAGSHGRDI